MPDLYFLWAQQAYLYSYVNLGHYCVKKRSLAALRGKSLLICWGHAVSLTSLSRKSRKRWCYFVIDYDLANGCQTWSFFSNEGSKSLPVFTFPTCYLQLQQIQPISMYLKVVLLINKLQPPWWFCEACPGLFHSRESPRNRHHFKVLVCCAKQVQIATWLWTVT